MSYSLTENHKRNVRVLAEGARGKKKTRMVDTYEYESLADCIRSDQVPASDVAKFFKDKKFYSWYKRKYLR